MGVSIEFARWATGFSGCDGGNLHGSVWICGIEWGTGAVHELASEIKQSVTSPPQVYRHGSENLNYPFNIKALKLISALRGGTVTDYRRVAAESPFPFHQKSDYFKLNLFPIAFRRLDARTWDAGFAGLTGLPSVSAYLDWCRRERFPSIAAWMREGRPKLVIGVGTSSNADFQRAFPVGGTERTEQVEGKTLIWQRDALTTLAIVPFLGQFQLDSDSRIQAFGSRLREIAQRA